MEIKFKSSAKPTTLGCNELAQLQYKAVKVVRIEILKENGKAIEADSNFYLPKIALLKMWEALGQNIDIVEKVCLARIPHKNFLLKFQLKSPVFLPTISEQENAEFDFIQVRRCC